MKVVMTTVVLILGLIGGTLAETDIRWIGKHDWAAVTKLHVDLVFNCTLTKDDNGTSVIVGQNATTTVDPTTVNWHMPAGASNETGGKIIDVEGSLHIHNISMSDQGIYLCSVQTDCSANDCNSTLLWFKHGLNLNGPIYADLLDKYRMNLIIGSASAGGVLGFFMLACLIYKLRYKEENESNFGEADIYTGTRMTGTDLTAEESYKQMEMSSHM